MGHQSQKRLSYLLPFLREQDNLSFECIGNKVMRIKCIGERNLSILSFCYVLFTGVQTGMLQSLGRSDVILWQEYCNPVIS